MGLSFSGFNGIDTETLITKLMYLEKAPLRKLEENKKDIQTQISAWQALNSALDTFKTKAGDLSDIFNKMAPSVDDDEILTATANSFAESGNYEINVKQLFQAHTVASSAEVVTDTTVTGSFDLNINGYTINIDVTNATIYNIAEKINNTKIDHDGDSSTDEIHLAEASVVDNKLVIKASGEVIGEGTKVNELSFSNETNNILADLNIDTASLNVIQNHRMAIFTVNGLEVERGSNEGIDDVIKGVTLNLEGKLNEPTTLRVGTDKKAMKEKVQAFVNQYNSLLDTLNKYGHPDQAQIESGEGAAVLSGEATISTIETMMYSSVMSPNKSISSADWLSNTPLSWAGGTTQDLVINGKAVPLDGALTLEQIVAEINNTADTGVTASINKDNKLVLESNGSLTADLTGSNSIVLRDLMIPATFKNNVVSLLGIELEKDGKLSIDEEKLDKALTENISDVKQMFAGAGGIIDRVETNVDNAIKSYSYSSGGGYVAGRISTLQKEIKYIDEDIEDMEKHLDMREETIKAKFTAMDQLISQMKSQSSWFTSTTS